MSRGTSVVQYCEDMADLIRRGTRRISPRGQRAVVVGVSVHVERRYRKAGHKVRAAALDLPDPLAPKGDDR